MELHPYQSVAVDWLRSHDRAGLFLDMGLGKTLCCLSALEPRHFPVVVVAPKRVAETVWAAEIGKWELPYDVAVAKGTPSERARQIALGAPITVISRDNQGDLLTVKHPPYRTLIIDELSGYKGRGVRYKQLRQLEVKDNIDHVWGLTGTPSPNGYLDLWPQIALLDQGARLGKNITTYRSRYFFPGRQLPSGVIVEWLLRPEAEANIKGLISDLCIAMETDGRIELPPVTINPVAVELPPRARKAYTDIKDTLVADVTDLLGGEIHTAGNAAILTSKLSQITAGFLYVDDADIRDSHYTVLHTAKLDALREIVDSVDSPILVFYHFKAELAEMERVFPQGERLSSDLIEKWNRGEVPLMFAHPASAGHGLNLQDGGHTIVWSTLPWSLEEWEQSNKRLARQGQRHPVVIHTLLADRSIDPLILARLRSKAALQDDLLSHLESPI